MPHFYHHNSDLLRQQRNRTWVTAYATVCGDAIVRTGDCSVTIRIFLTATTSTGKRSRARQRRRASTPQAFTDAMDDASFQSTLFDQPQRLDTTISSERQSLAISRRRARRSGVADSGRGLYLRRRSMKGGMRPMTRRSIQRRSSSTAAVRCGSGPRGSRQRGKLFLQAVGVSRSLSSRFYERDPEFVDPRQPAAMRSSGSFVKAGLKDIERQPHVGQRGACLLPRRSQTAWMYVWFDALTNYVTVAGSLTDTAKIRQIVAGRRSSDGQGNRAFPRRVSGRRF